MAMSKKDYVAIAAIIKRHAEAGGLGDGGVLYNNAAKNIAFDMSDKFDNENPRFKRAVFLKACGVSQ